MNPQPIKGSGGPGATLGLNGKCFSKSQVHSTGMGSLKSCIKVNVSMRQARNPVEELLKGPSGASGTALVHFGPVRVSVCSVAWIQQRFQ